jgi:hypothetical protein
MNATAMSPSIAALPAAVLSGSLAAAGLSLPESQR